MVMNENLNNVFVTFIGVPMATRIINSFSCIAVLFLFIVRKTQRQKSSLHLKVLVQI